MIESIEAQVHFLSPEEGGRKSKIFTGYRPTFFWDGHEELGGNDGRIILEGHDECSPGEDSTLKVEFYRPELLPDTISQGTTFTIREGKRIIGRGHVQEILEQAKNGP